MLSLRHQIIKVLGTIGKNIKDKENEKNIKTVFYRSKFKNGGQS
jgi:hypothetical protein